MLVDYGIIPFWLGALIWSIINCIMLFILYKKALKERDNKK